MKSVTVLNTEISTTTVEEVSELLNSENKNSCICNVNTLVRSINLRYK